MREIIGILRGVKPAEVESVCEVLISAGIAKIEVPMNSPDPLQSISLLAKRYSSDALIGAGTVLSAENVNDVSNAGGTFIVSPNCNTSVIEAAKSNAMLSYPGVFTASECFSALDAGADGLKLFPASVLGIDGLKALRAVVPADVAFYGVSGISAEHFAAWIAAGLTGFGIGSNLYKPGLSIDTIRANAIELVTAYDACVS